MKLFRGSVVLAAFAFFGVHAKALDWTNTGPDDSFDDGANWTSVTGTGVVPGPNDSVHIFPGFTTVANPTKDQIDVVGGGSTDITITTTNDQSIKSLLVSSNFDETSESGTLNFEFNGGSTLTVGTDGAVITGGATMNYTGNLQMSEGEMVVGTTTSTIDEGQVTGPATVNLTSGSFNFNGTASFVIGQGTTGTMVQGVTGTSSSTVTLGDDLIIGTEGGTGTYTLEDDSVLQSGSAGFTAILIGDSDTTGDGSSGTLNVGGSSTFTVSQAGYVVVGGADPSTTDVTGGNGTINQTGTSTVNLGSDDGYVYVGEAGGTGIYNLSASGAADETNLNITDNTTILGYESGSTGTLNQTGGTMTVGTAPTLGNPTPASTSFVIGEGGTGIYNFSGGDANFIDGFAVGGEADTGTGSGTVNQSDTNGASTLVASEDVTVGGAAGTDTGTYNLSGGSDATATFDGGLTVGTTGTVHQTGGVLTIATGESLDLSANGSTYNLDGGTLQVGEFTGDNTTNTTSGLNIGDGGKLQVEAATLTDPFNGTLTGQAVIDAAHAVDSTTETSIPVTNVTFAGTLSGSGNLVLDGENTVTTFNFTTPETYTGGTTLNGGTLDVSIADLPTTGPIALATGTYLDLTAPADSTQVLASSISGAGNIDTTTGGTFNLELTGALNVTGTTTIGAGNLQVYHGTLGNVEGTTAAVTIGGDSLVDGATVPSSGAVTLAGTNTYTGQTTVNSGFTLYTNNLAGNVVSSGALGLPTGGSYPGTATFSDPAGDLNSTGTLLVRVAGTTTSATSDSYDVKSASLYNAVGVSGYGTHTYTIVSTSAPGQLTTGTLNTPGPTGLEAETDSTLLTATLSVDDPADPQYLYLTTEQGSLAGYGQTPNQRAVGGALDQALATSTTGSDAAFLEGLDRLTVSQIPGVLDQLSPESLQYPRSIAFENATFLSEQVDSRLANIRAGEAGLDTSGLSILDSGLDSSLGRSLGSLLAYSPPSNNRPAPNGVNYYPQDDYSPSSGTPVGGGDVISDTATQPIVTTSHPFVAPRMTEFISGDVILADLNQNASAGSNTPQKASYTAGSATAGVAFRMSSNLAAGVLFDYNHTDAQTDSQGSHTKVDSYSPGVFATFFEKGFYVNGLFSYGYNTYSNNRNIRAGSFGATANSSPNGSQYVGNIDLGYDFRPSAEWQVGPTIGATYTHLDVDSFQESGAGPADLSVDSQSANSLRTRLGAHVAYEAQAGSILFEPNVFAAWQHEFLDDNFGLTSQFDLPGTSPFTIQGTALGKDSALLGIGLTATLNNSLVFYLNYLADAGADNYFAQSVEGGVKGRF